VKSRKIIYHAKGAIRLTIEEIEGEASLHLYNLARQDWLRGARLLGKYGAEQALNLIEERAERSVGRGHIETAQRWRRLIIAIHAIERDERLGGEEIH
jgi:hypothetical protein